MWAPKFETFPSHPVTRGVKPFSTRDEWYFNIRFTGDISGNEAAKVEGKSFDRPDLDAWIRNAKAGSQTKGYLPLRETKKGRVRL